ncbi:MAG: hypothetical protein B7Z53_04720 [Rhodospirillales bacterium 12-71-4]|nr:MAG: hypothetical protein B7Z53_04720 [Rhodospirillales bacterium 12-71-4]
MRTTPRLILGFLLLALPLGAAPGPAWAQNAPAAGAAQPDPAVPVRIVNRTGQPATALHAVRSGRPDWGSNLLNRGPLPNNAAFAMRPSASAGCHFDIRLVLQDGRESTARNQDICGTPRVELSAAVTVAPAASVAQARPNTAARRVSTGTGFVVAADRVLTNQHVVDGCDRILARTPDGRWLAAVPPAQVDRALDLSILSIPGNPGPALAFRAGPAVRRGESVVAYCFPLTQGHVVGVVVAKLDSRRVQNVDNVNFAVKGEAAQAFLRRAGLAFRTEASSGADRSAADVGDIAHRSTVLLRCER